MVAAGQSLGFRGGLSIASVIGEAVRSGGPVELIQHDAGLDDRLHPFAVDRHDTPAMRREVDNDRVVDGLSGQRRPAPTRQDRQAVVKAPANDGRGGSDRRRDDDTQRLDLVDARIGRIQHAVVVAKPDRSAVTDNGLDLAGDAIEVRRRSS